VLTSVQDEEFYRDLGRKVLVHMDVISLLGQTRHRSQPHENDGEIFVSEDENEEES